MKITTKNKDNNLNIILKKVTFQSVHFFLFKKLTQFMAVIQCISFHLSSLACLYFGDAVPKFQKKNNKNSGGPARFLRVGTCSYMVFNLTKQS